LRDITSQSDRIYTARLTLRPCRSLRELNFHVEQHRNATKAGNCRRVPWTEEPAATRNDKNATRKIK
jgi:hypothetical protein